jgi:hypothetical protein
MYTAFIENLHETVALLYHRVAAPLGVDGMR